MRVTSNTFPNALLDQISRLTVRQSRLQQQAATGQRLELPEDDPTAMRRVLDLQNEAKTVSQYKRNVERLQEVASTTHGTIKGLKKVLDRAGEIATLADGTKSEQDLKDYASEVTELIKQALQFANAKNRGDYLLAGTKSDTAPFVATTNTSGQVTAVAYAGNTSLSESEVAEAVTLVAHTLGANSTGAGPRALVTDSTVGADLFNHLISLQNNLINGDRAAISGTDTANLGKDEENFLYHLSGNGAVQARLETVLSATRDRGDSIEKVVSSEADADLAQTIVRLNETQNAYRAALQSGANVLSRSLLDFLS